jgi:hypothetical protein
MKYKKIKVNDSLQKGYSYYLTEPTGKNFDPEFKPELTPKQMLELGVFGGLYLYDCQKEFPKEWFKKAKMVNADVTVEANHQKNLNFFGVNASKPLKYWKQKGWLHEQDPRGWFLWYCRYYLGRRSEDDKRQIKRWKAIKRHIAQVMRHCKTGDFKCRPKQRQAILHWAYDSRKI